jgi:hypothetical protein
VHNFNIPIYETQHVKIADGYDYTYPTMWPYVKFYGPTQVEDCGEYIIAHRLPDGEFSNSTTKTVPAQYEDQQVIVGYKCECGAEQ